eukprot:360150-Chlamydomonas_euryale.AAC.3
MAPRRAFCRADGSVQGARHPRGLDRAQPAAFGGAAAPAGRDRGAGDRGPGVGGTLAGRGRAHEARRGVCRIALPVTDILKLD